MIDIWVVLSEVTFIHLQTLEKKIMNKGKIDKPFFFIITEMVPFVTCGFFYIFNLFFSMDGCINNGRKKSFLSNNIELSVMNKNKEFDRQ